ncbi:MAG: hypothetical protein DDT32_01228 [Syntrophomonadaceae bacterium]|nr:hypothetical protein [Bacillota bacterium]MBT9147471.1 hypothetical protein [Bacillota bacterium]
MIDTIIEIGQAIGGYAALATALLAAFMVYLTWKYSPIRMMRYKSRSEQLKQIISQWLKEIRDTRGPAEPASFPSTPGYIQIPEERPYALRLETNILFQDLPNYLDASLWKKWAEYKKAWIAITKQSGS